MGDHPQQLTTDLAKLGSDSATKIGEKCNIRSCVRPLVQIVYTRLGHWRFFGGNLPELYVSKLHWGDL